MVLKKKKKKEKQAALGIGKDDAPSGEANIPSPSVEGTQSPIPVKQAVKPYNVVSRFATSSVGIGERERLREEAVALVKQHITSPSEKGKEDGSGPFVPRSWAANYKTALGPYKKFIQEQKGVFVIVEETSDNFQIKLAGDPTAVSNETPWKRDLLKAWVQYVQKVPKGERTADHFTSVLRGHKAAAPLFSGSFVRVPKGEYVQSLPIPAAAAVPPAMPSDDEGQATAAAPVSTIPAPTGSEVAPAVTVAAAARRKKKAKVGAKVGAKVSAKARAKADVKAGEAVKVRKKLRSRKNTKA